MKSQISPVVFIVLIVLAVIGLGVVSWKALTGSGDNKAVVVKPDNPNDPKFHPDPKLGLGGGPPAAQAPQ